MLSSDNPEAWFAAGCPYYAPPTFRSMLWAFLRRRPQPEWREVDHDPNPHERWWRRG